MKPQHQPDRKRFTLPTTPISTLYYALRPGRIDFTHTIVPAEYRGRGLASLLAEAGLSWARSQGLKVIATCPLVAAYLKWHPEWQDLL